MNTLVVPHDPRWKALFLDEQAILDDSLGEQAIAIEHIGSTSIPGILAKPIIDILIEVVSVDELDKLNPVMESVGYEVMGEFGIESRRYFRKTNAFGRRTHHVHAFSSSSPHLLRHLAFRDFLIAHPETAQRYSEIKAKLTKHGQTSMEAYISGKEPFIKQTEADAVAWALSRN